MSSGSRADFISELCRFDETKAAVVQKRGERALVLAKRDRIEGDCEREADGARLAREAAQEAEREMTDQVGIIRACEGVVEDLKAEGARLG